MTNEQTFVFEGVDLGRLKALGNAISLDKSRPYLYNFRLEYIGSTQTLIATVTDGHRLFVWRVGEFDNGPTNAAANLPISITKNVKVSAADPFGTLKIRGSAVMLEYNGALFSADDNQSYPDWRFAVPSLCPDTPVVFAKFNNKYVGDLVKLEKAFGGTATILPTDARGPAFVKFDNNDIFGFLMPVRNDASLAQVDVSWINGVSDEQGR